MDDSSDFPTFSDGDTCIIISISQTFRLHSTTLRRMSPVFSNAFEAFPAPRLTSYARSHGSVPYRFELVRNVEDDVGHFVRIKVTDNGKPVYDFDFPGSVNLNLSAPDHNESNRSWSWLFGSFYNIMPKFDDHNLAIVLSNCMGLVDVADSVGSLEHVREIVDLALLRQDQNLWQSIATNPTAWTELGYRVHSPTIFREGMIHLVGLWPRINEDEKSGMRADVRALAERKHAELDVAKQAINMRILGHYPSFLCRSHTTKPQRTSYSADIYMWMALCFFRQWYAQAIADGRTGSSSSAHRGRDGADGGFIFYTALAEGGHAYLHHEDFRAFHQYFPMSAKACNVLKTHMNALKEEVRTFVKDLVAVRCHLKPGGDDLDMNWLTCALIEKADLPWESNGRPRTGFTNVEADGGLDLDLDAQANEPANADVDLGLDPEMCIRMGVNESYEGLYAVDPALVEISRSTSAAETSMILSPEAPIPSTPPTPLKQEGRISAPMASQKPLQANGQRPEKNPSGGRDRAGHGGRVSKSRVVPKTNRTTTIARSKPRSAPNRKVRTKALLTSSENDDKGESN